MGAGPWRQLKETGVELETTVKNDINAIQTKMTASWPKVTPRILLIGPASAGKSSFINSCLSVVEGRKVSSAATGNSETSYTLHYTCYNDYELLKTVLMMDCMGLEQDKSKGLRLDDIFALLQGNILEDYKFDQTKSILATPGSKFYKPNPKFEDRVHCVVFVIEASSMYLHNKIKPDYLNQIRKVQEIVKDTGTQRVLILTKADKLSRDVFKDKANAFKSSKIEKAVDVASEVFDIDKGSIHPVVNYVDTFQLNTEQNNLILLALCQSLQYAFDNVNLYCRKNKKLFDN